MRAISEATEATETPTTETFTFSVGSVTGAVETEVEFDRRTPANAVTRAVANKLGLTTNTPWQLRSDRTSAFLDDDKPIGDQISPGERVTVTPKAHLG